MEVDQAMQEYISCVNVLDPEGCTKVKRTIPEKSKLNTKTNLYYKLRDMFFLRFGIIRSTNIEDSVGQEQ